MRRFAFTLVELVFVVVIMGLVSKFGIEFLARAYESFIASSINNSLQSQTSLVVETIAARLQYRIKDSIIARNPTNGTFDALASSTLGTDATVLEWIGYDIDGFYGGDDNSSWSSPLWSGIIDLYHPSTTASTLFSPETNTTKIDAMIGVLSDGGSGINNAALYFIGSNSDIRAGYGWYNSANTHNSLTTQNATMHPINIGATETQFISKPSTAANFSGTDLYEYYQLAWSAYAIAQEGTDLWLYYDYQPWNGDTYKFKSDGITPTKKTLLMQNVDTFRFRAIGSVVKIQVCVNQNIVKGYSLCKEKTIF